MSSKDDSKKKKEEEEEEEGDGDGGRRTRGGHGWVSVIDASKWDEADEDDTFEISTR